jgi:hypothetical protein
LRPTGLPETDRSLLTGSFHKSDPADFPAAQTKGGP